MMFVTPPFFLRLLIQGREMVERWGEDGAFERFIEFMGLHLVCRAKSTRREEDFGHDRGLRRSPASTAGTHNY